MTSPSPEKPNAAQDFWLTVLRTLIGRCPKCGHGRLFKSYLKPVEQCATCGEALGHIRADDGPAWLTILVVGHIMGSLMLALPWDEYSDTVMISGVTALTIVMSLAVLPYAKGFFIGMIWRAECVGTEK